MEHNERSNEKKEEREESFEGKRGFKRNQKLISNYCFPRNYDFARNFRKQEAEIKRNSLPVIHPRFRFESTEPRLAGRLDAEARLLIKIWRSGRQSQPLWLRVELQ